ncbi:MAG: ABC transporter ATP-binding protein [Ekhidna sp.]|nr:ABC transporter ATP-binding protein [Ekhidna sp.]
MLSLNNIRLSYGSKKILESVSLDIREGAVICLVGENGAGKTSLMNVLSDLVPFKGKIKIDGETIHKKDYLYKLNFGFFLKENGFFSTDISVSDHFHLIHDLYGKPDNFYQRIEFHKKMLNISSQDSTLIRDLSEGTRHKILFICTISHNPKYILLDEPFNYMDESSIDKCISILKELKKKGNGILLITHNSAHIKQLADTVALLDNGYCSVEENVAEIMRKGSLESSKNSFLNYMKRKYSKN